MPGIISPLKGSSQRLPGRATSTRGTDQNLTPVNTQTTTLAGISRLDPLAEVARGPGGRCSVVGVGLPPCMAPDEGHPHDGVVLPSPSLILLIGLAGTSLAMALPATRCHHPDLCCGRAPVPTLPSLAVNRPSLPWDEGVRCLLEAEVEP